MSATVSECYDSTKFFKRDKVSSHCAETASPRFKRITDPRAAAYADRFSAFTSAQIAYDDAAEEYSVDEDQDSAADYVIGDPDFNVGDFNSNLVLRWEYMPGSLFYVVWSQARSNFSPVGTFELERNLNSLFDQHSHDVFLVKFVRWFSV